MNAISTTIAKRIRAKQRGWVFTPKDFLDVVTRATVDQTLSRLVRKGILSNQRPFQNQKVAGRTIILKHARVPLMDRISRKANFMLGLYTIWAKTVLTLKQSYSAPIDWTITI